MDHIAIIIEKDESYRFIRSIEIACECLKLFTYNFFYRFQLHVNRILIDRVEKSYVITTSENLYKNVRFSPFYTEAENYDMIESRELQISFSIDSNRFGK